MTEKNEEAFLSQVLQGNGEAVDFCQRLFRVSQVLDDLVDGDREVTAGDVKLVFWDALVEIPANGFYQRHFSYLHPLVAAAFMDWEDATDLEKMDEHGRNLAFVWRDSISSLVAHCALLIGGRAWQRRVSVTIRRFFLDETLDDYKVKLK